MPRPKFAEGNPGRPKGSKNKFTSLKDSFLEAFEEIGGTKELARWAAQTQNKGQFFQMITKMLPNKVEATGENGGPIQVQKIKWED